MWRRPRPCKYHARESDDSHEPDESRESDDSHEPDELYDSYQLGAAYEPNESDKPNEFHERGGSGQRTERLTRRNELAVQPQKL
ncbi:hypothetical protein [Mycobacterium arosiense]|uniref:hypothetical protein n=1 Tax=Mycobacterium arosiense TaxID=425468 RepID=UPI001301FC0B|nr:hypothetical protein [Mycobacterium arosiense]